MADTGQIWMHLSADVSMGVDRNEAMTMTEAQLAGLYMNHVYGSSENEAMDWAARQVEERNEALYLDWYLGDDALKQWWPVEYEQLQQ